MSIVHALQHFHTKCLRSNLLTKCLRFRTTPNIRAYTLQYNRASPHIFEQQIYNLDHAAHKITTTVEHNRTRCLHYRTYSNKMPTLWNIFEQNAYTIEHIRTRCQRFRPSSHQKACTLDHLLTKRSTL